MNVSPRTGLSKDERLCSWFDKLTTSDVSAISNSPL